MATKSPVGKVTICILVITVVFLPLCLDATRKGPYEYYKIIYRWSESYCRERLGSCYLPVPDHFVIQSLWPMYWVNFALEPFNNSECTTITPAGEDQVLNAIREGGILQKMNRYWPNIHKFDRGQLTRTESNEIGWKYEWTNRGKCFDHPDNPFHYFNTASTFARDNKMEKILKDATITPDDSYGYEASAIVNAIQDHLGVDIQIFCNEDGDGLKQLHQVAVCFNRNGNKINCRNTYNDCTESQTIGYPVPTKRE